MKQFPTILSSYDPDIHFDELEKLKRPGLYRWNKGVELWQSGLPTLDVMLAYPHKSDSELLQNITEFVHRWQSSGNAKLMVVRQDSFTNSNAPPSSHEPYTENLKPIMDEIKRSIANGFVPSLWALPALRIHRKMVAGIMFVSADKIVVEMFGAGHDVADISKGVARPAAVITMKPYAPPFMELDLSRLENYIDIQNEDENMRDARIRSRIKFLAQLNGRTVAAQTEIMKTESELFVASDNFKLSEIKKLFRFARKYAEHRMSHNLPFVNHAIAATMASNDRWLFDNAWDANKYK
jgi:hypothetical protein